MIVIFLFLLFSKSLTRHRFENKTSKIAKYTFNPPTTKNNQSLALQHHQYNLIIVYQSSFVLCLWSSCFLICLSCLNALMLHHKKTTKINANATNNSLIMPMRVWLVCACVFALCFYCPDLPFWNAFASQIVLLITLAGFYYPAC